MIIYDRELSWLQFNRRCLNCALREELPIGEKLNFIGISDSNLREFISVRFSNVYNEYNENKNDIYSDTSEKYKYILNDIFVFKNEIYKVLDKVIENHSELFINFKKLSKLEIDMCKRYFLSNIAPVLTPIAVEKNKDVPILNDSELHFAIHVKDEKSNVICIIPIPKQLPRLIQIRQNKFIMIEDIIELYIHRLFLNKKIKNITQFRIYRYINDLKITETDVLVDKMQQYLAERDFTNKIIFLDIKNDNSLNKIIRQILGVQKEHVYVTNKPLLLDFLSTRFYNGLKGYYNKFIPKQFNVPSIMKYLNKDDLLLHHPYDDFNTIIKLLKEASCDKDVISIKITLYRVSGIDSPIIDTLCNASLNGKKVIVILELMARFSERINIAIINKLKTSGVIIIYGCPHYKVHSKFMLIFKKTKKDVIKIYSHISTGNYNEITSKLYTDISYLTSNNIIGSELSAMFNAICGYFKIDNFERTFWSPYTLKSKLISLINREIKYAKKNKKSSVFMKINSLFDLEIIKTIEIAAKAGVKFRIICRGICTISSQKNIKITSIIGRFLEHSRIYMFRNNDNPEYYISSADLLTRNLNNRIELMVNIQDKSCKKQIQSIIDIFLNDNYNSYKLENNENKLLKKRNFNCHSEFMR